MDAVAQQQVLAGIDVIGSAGNPGADLHRISEVWRGLLRKSLLAAGISLMDLLEWRSEGDGAVFTVPHAFLGRVVDMAPRLHHLTAEYNRRNRPEVRLRMAVLTGPVPAEPTFAKAKIDRARLLDAPAFKALIARCHAESGTGAHTGLIIADHAFQTVFSGDHTELVHRAEFAEISVAAKEFRATAWVRVPGFDARSLRTFLATEPAAEPAPEDEPAPAEQGSGGTVHQTVHGPMSGIQAHTVHGGIRIRRTS